MNLTALITAVRTRLGVPTTDAFMSDTNLTDLINAGLEYATSQGDWYWLETTESVNTTNAVEYVTPNASSQRTIGLYDSTGIPLQRVRIDELRRFPAAATGANTRYFSALGARLYLRPVPNGTIALTHDYVTSEPRLASGSDTPLMPSQFHDVIADYACYFANLRQGQVQEADKWKASGDAWVAQMAAHSDRYAETAGGGAEPQ